MLSNSLPSSAVSYHGSAVWTAMQARRWRSHPGKPLAAGCKAASRHAEVVRGTHDTPQADCTCGVYATKSFDHLHRTGYDLRGICGAVWLWGKVVEHKFGWRAQLLLNFGYPAVHACRNPVPARNTHPVQHRYCCRQPGWQSPPVDSRFGIRTGRTGLPRRGEETGIRALEANPETGRPRGGHWSWDRHREDA